MKNYISIFILAIMPLLFVSCEDDDDFAALEKAYQTLQSGIVGTWELREHYISSTSNPYVKLGWNAAMLEESLTFGNNGIATNQNGESFSYAIVLDKSYTAMFTKSTDGSDYWPFDKGVIFLYLQDEYSHTYFAEIKNDGKLYFYETKYGSGEPAYRYVRK